MKTILSDEVPEAIRVPLIVMAMFVVNFTTTPASIHNVSPSATVRSAFTTYGECSTVHSVYPLVVPLTKVGPARYWKSIASPSAVTPQNTSPMPTPPLALVLGIVVGVN